MQRGLCTQPTPPPPTSPRPPATRAQTQALMDAKVPRTRSCVLDKQSLVEMSPTKKPAPHPYSHITKFGPPKGVKKNAPNGKSVSAMTDTALAISSKSQVAGGSISVENRSSPQRPEGKRNSNDPEPLSTLTPLPASHKPNRPPSSPSASPETHLLNSLLQPDPGDSDGLVDLQAPAARWQKVMARRKREREAENQERQRNTERRERHRPTQSRVESEEAHDIEIMSREGNNGSDGADNLGLQPIGERASSSQDRDYPASEHDTEDTPARIVTGGGFDSDENALEDSRLTGAVSPQNVQDDTASESGPSGSDYATTRKEKIHKREREHQRGKSVSDTTEEDQEADKEMAADVVSEGRTGGCKRKGHSTRKHKKKAHTRTEEDHTEVDGDEGDDEDDVDVGKRSRHVTGPLSKEAMAEIRDFGQKTVKAAEALASKLRKPTRSIMIAAGLGVEHSRHGENFSNKFKIWYRNKYPISKDSSFADYRDQIHNAYREFQAKNPKTNKAAYEKACQPIIDYCKSLDEPIDFFGESKKSMLTRMDNVKHKFTDLAGAYWNLDEILIFGAVLYLGNDVAASHAGTFFAGSDLVKHVVDSSGTDMRQFMDQLTTACKTVRLNKQGGLFKLPTLIDPIFTTTNGARDRDKKIVGNFLVAEIQSLISHQSDHFRWERWCNFAYKNRLVLVGWDPTVQPPGPDFCLKGAGAISTNQWQSLVKRINWKGNLWYDIDLPELHIERWEDDVPAEGDDISQVSLVTDGEGNPLRTVADSKIFQQEQSKSSKRSRSARGQRKSQPEDCQGEDSGATHRVLKPSKKERHAPSPESEDDGGSMHSDRVETRRKVPLSSRAEEKQASKGERHAPSREISDDDRHSTRSDHPDARPNIHHKAQLPSRADEKRSSKKKQLAPSHKISNNDMRSPHSNHAKARPRAPLPSRAKEKQPDKKRRRTNHSEDEDNDGFIPALQNSSQSRSIQRPFAPPSHSSSHPPIMHPASNDVPPHAVANPSARHNSPQVNSTIPGGSAPGTSYGSSHPLASHRGTGVFNAPMSAQSSFMPYSHQRQGLPPIAEEGRFNMGYRNIRPRANQRFLHPEPTQMRQMPFTNMRQPQNLVGSSACMTDDRHHPAILQPEGQTHSHPQYADGVNDYPAYGEDMGIGWGYNDMNYAESDSYPRY